MNDDFTTGFDNSFGVGGNDFAVYDPLDVTDLTNYTDMTGISPLSFYHAARLSEETDRMFAESDQYIQSVHRVMEEENLRLLDDSRMFEHHHPLQQAHFADQADEPVLVSSQKAPLSVMDMIAIVIVLAILAGFGRLVMIVYKTNFVY